MILESLLSALAQMGDARFRGVLLRAIGITVAMLLAFSAALVWGAGWLVGDSLTLPWIGTVTWVDNVLSWAMLPVTLVLSVVLMVPVASAVTGMFLEEVAAAVEDRHYPQEGVAPAVPFAEGLRDALGFLGTMAMANLLALVLYLLFLPLSPLIFWALNGFLLGREYYVLAAMRRVGRQRAYRLFRRHLLPIWAGGVLMALPLSVPVLNLLVPVVGAATFTHIYHRLTAKGGGV